jgi:hypothetical protein
MRFFVFIPVFVLFLSNVPFIQDMPEEMESCRMEKMETCSMNMQERADNTCVPGERPSKKCCGRSETTSTCICIFCFSAPEQEIKGFQFNALNLSAQYTGYLQSMWKDPHIAAPGQPPDQA